MAVRCLTSTATSTSLTHSSPKPSLCQSSHTTSSTTTKTTIKPHSLLKTFSSLQTLKTKEKQKQRQKQKLGFEIRCSIKSPVEYEDDQISSSYPRPPEIPWKKEMANLVNLIGIVGTPVQIKHLNSGKVLAWSRLAVKKSSTDTLWINLTFWDELALVAFQHVQKGDRIFVCGRLASDTVESEDERRQTYYKVVVQQLNFVEKTFAPVPLYDPDSNYMTEVGSVGKYSGNHVSSAEGQIGRFSGNQTTSTEELWQAFFANPVDWWDNRRNKRNPKYPDFKHKHTGEALWIEGRYSPSWVKSQLAILDERMESVQANSSSTPVAFMSGEDLSSF